MACFLRRNISVIACHAAAKVIKKANDAGVDRSIAIGNGVNIVRSVA
jgi:hypothetical protein